MGFSVNGGFDSPTEDDCKPPGDLVFRGSFTQVRNEGLRRGRFLIVNVQDYRGKENVINASKEINRNLWNNDEIRSILKKNFLLWQVTNFR